MVHNLGAGHPPKERVGQKGNVLAQGKLGVLWEEEFCRFWAHLQALYVPAHEKMQILTQLSKSIFRHLVIENSTNSHIIHEEQWLTSDAKKSVT